jgi:hypothetical protein
MVALKGKLQNTGFEVLEVVAMHLLYAGLLCC